MTWKPGQSGNPLGHGHKPKIWRDAIIRALKRRESKDPLAVEKLADNLLRAMDEGDISAMKEFGDRVEGKVSQPIGGADDLPAQKVQLDFSKLSDQQLDALEEILKAAAGQSGPIEADDDED